LNTSLNNPALIFKVVEFSGEIPETGHEMNHEEYTGSNLGHTNHTLIYLQTVEELHKLFVAFKER
jgi:hypothetical protein